MDIEIDRLGYLSTKAGKGTAVPPWSYNISLHPGLRMGKKPEGDGGNQSPGEGGGRGPGPGPATHISDWPNGDRAKLGVSGGGYWNPGDSSG